MAANSQQDLCWMYIIIIKLYMKTARRIEKPNYMNCSIIKHFLKDFTNIKILNQAK